MAQQWQKAAEAVRAEERAKADFARKGVARIDPPSRAAPPVRRKGHAVSLAFGCRLEGNDEAWIDFLLPLTAADCS